MRIFVICSVRNASTVELRDQQAHIRNLESHGYQVHYPPRDTDQTARGYDICRQNYRAILDADEVHVLYTPDSQGTHFDLGVAFALGKKIRVFRSVPYGEGKSFARMLDEWVKEQDGAE